MRRLGECILVLAVATLATAPVAAQRQGRGGGGPGFGGPLMLLTQKSVQDELKVTADQVQKIQDLQAKQRESSQGLRDLSREERRQKMQEMAKANEQALAGILNPEQSKRLQQISLQLRGAAAFADPKVADALNLTDEQKQKIQTIQQDARNSMRELRQSGNREEARQKGQEIRKDSLAKVMNILTDEQKAKWKDLTGESFKGEMQFQRPGRQRPGGNQNRRAGDS
jgi:Spy/CpxP family protein refolding chaperone